MEILLIRGLPGSGKTTWAERFARRPDVDYVHCEADQFFMKDDQYIYDPTKIKEAHDYCYDKAFDALSEGKSVVVANTFCRKWEMEAYYRLAASFLANVRVMTAKGNLESVHNVPQDVIERMREQWED